MYFEFQRESSELRCYSPKTQDWLHCQRALNRLVTMLVNGDTAFSKKRPIDWVYCFINPKPELWRGAYRFDSFGPYTRRLQRYLGGKWITLSDIYAALKESENFLLDPPTEIATEMRYWNVHKQSSHKANHPVIDQMCKILRPLREDLSVYVHGSMATGDHTPFSDVDDLVILHQNSWACYEHFRQVVLLLEKTTRLFQRFDPLQHHGHWVFLNFDMICLDQSTMPLVVLENAIVVVGPREGKANIRNEPRSFGRILWTIIQEVRRDALSLVQGKLNIYGLKNLISGISLLPALAFQVHGKFLDKKTAILRSDEMFSEQAILAIQWATKVREGWASCHGYGWVRIMRYINRTFPFRRIVLERIAKNYSPSVHPDQVPFLSEQIITDIFELTNECARQLQEVVVK